MSVTSHLARIAVPALLALCGAALATAGTTALGAASHGYGAGRTAHSAEAPALAAAPGTTDSGASAGHGNSLIWD
ncbi:hypothetical protein [Streptomyces sp. WAC08241]|uniref:hypothetical protein n=1 Tax=Streptomyces sp. WAC08241 TaxID=2487421 RepID=UPI000F773DA6|nr:hypothetical protein [Streptomyces sp. WAC08241]RSS44236.1 hypothetical protein EF906_07620 [Streptomyces sp. WAC08241]